MKKSHLALFTFLFSLPSAADTLHFESVALPDLLKTVYGQILKKGYVLEDGLSDKKLSLMMDYNSPYEAELMLNESLNNSGLIAIDKNGYSFIKKISVAPYAFVYKPKNRAVTYLMPLARAAFPHLFVGDASVLTAESDVISLHIPLDNHAVLQDFLTSLDTPVPQILVSGVAYEVTLSSGEGHSFELVANLLSSKLGIEIKPSNLSASGASVIKFSGFNIQSALKILDTDTRFKSVSRPSVRVRSGGAAKFNSGSDVPILGSVVTNQGVTSQSVEYRSSGVLFDVQPVLFTDSINLKLKQEFSSFVQSEVGVVNSPTLNKRLIQTELDLKNGDVIMIGGLNDSTSTDSTSSLPFLKMLPFTSLKKQSSIETVMILEVKKI